MEKKYCIALVIALIALLISVGVVVLLCVLLIPDDTNSDGKSQTLQNVQLSNEPSETAQTNSDGKPEKKWIDYKLEDDPCPGNFRQHKSSGVPSGKIRCLHATSQTMDFIDVASQYCYALGTSRLPFPEDEDDAAAIFSFTRDGLSPDHQVIFLGYNYDYDSGWAPQSGREWAGDVTDLTELRGTPYECIKLDENGATDAKCDIIVSIVCELFL
ncbi:uncharacterized protein LOC142351569 [Convolutriloba macropyga]|uniref:uncharacterized protein LOC142351569 n=1 Tax=Convolutriloba macropyga TaxID=536237 RepID=UPI003F521654